MGKPKITGILYLTIASNKMPLIYDIALHFDQ